MTTLPQTTPLRLPRPAGGGTLMIPGTVPGMAVGQVNPANAAMTPADVFRVIRSNVWLIALFLLVGSVGGFFLNRFLARNYSRFTATGYVQVNIKTGFDPIKGVLTDNNSPSLNIEQRTQAQLLKHETLLSDVLQNSAELRETPWFKTFATPQDRKEALLSNFTVTPIPDSKLISVSMSCSIDKDCKTIIEQIVNTHLARQRQLATDKEYQRSTNLNNLKIRYQLSLRNLSQKINEKAVALSVDGSSPGRISAKDMELSEKVHKQLDLQQQFSEADASYKSIAASLQRGEDPAIIDQAVTADPSVMQSRRDIDMLDVQLAEAGTKWGKDHPSFMQIQTRRDMYQQKLTQLLEDLRAKQRVALVDATRAKMDMTKGQLDSINEQVKSLKSEMGELSNMMAEYLTARDEQKAMSDLLKEVNNQLDLIQQKNQQDLSGNVEWATYPATPDSPSFPKLPLTMSVAIGLALALSLGIAFLREVTDTSVRSPRDISRVGQMAMLGMIPHESDDPQSAGARLPLVIFEAPHSMIAEQFRQVRTRLQHAASLDTTRSLLVTSPSPGDGKSTVAANIAAGLALNGRRILLVDANFRRPDMHRIFGIGNEIGFSDVLNNLENFENAVRETQVPNLAILPSGPRPTNPTELLESQLLIDFIERSLEEYDHVVFDSGPLLFVSESMALAPRVDGVVSVVRARANSRGVLQRMRDALRQVKAEHLGVVLNGVRNQAGGYYGRNVKTYYEYQNNEA